MNIYMKLNKEAVINDKENNKGNEKLRTRVKN